MRRSLAGLACAGALSAAMPAHAHPHVWIDNTATFVFQQGRIGAIRLRWMFDEIFSASIIQQFDKNKDGKFDAAELKELEKGAFANLSTYSYFTYVTVDDKPVPTVRVLGFTAGIEKNQLVYEFTVPLDAPVDPLRQGFSFSVYDLEYFVELDMGGREGARFEGNAGIACRATVAENPSKRIYSGQVIPLEMRLKCEKAP
ncbi:MAG: DUF1007 family protein [Rhodospirillales bacterium]